MINYIKKHKQLAIIFIFFLVFLLWNKITLYIETVNFINTQNNSLTMVTPVLDTKIELDKNLIYCSTAQMAWNSLHNDIIKETIEIENQPWYVDKLNALVNLPPQISQDAYVALAGFGKDNIIEKIKDELTKKFHTVPNIQFPTIGRDDIFTFSYMIKILDFKEKFGTFYSDMTFNNKTATIKSFGYKGLIDYNEGESLKKQIKLLYFSENGFILELITTSTNDVIILSTHKPENTLLSTFNNITFLIKTNTNRIINRNINTFVVPKINFNIRHIFKDLVNKRFYNLNFKQHSISDAVQHVKFKLNEKGAIIESYSFFYAQGSSSSLKIEVKGPFTLFFKRKNATYPYFMAYFGNDELLERKQNILELFSDILIR